MRFLTGTKVQNDLEAELVGDTQQCDEDWQISQPVRNTGMTRTKAALATAGGAALFILGGVTAYFTLMRKSQEPECTSNATGALAVYYGNSSDYSSSNSQMVNPVLTQVAQFACDQVVCNATATFLAFKELVLPFMVRVCQQQQLNVSEPRHGRCANLYTDVTFALAGVECEYGGGDKGPISQQRFESVNNAMTFAIVGQPTP